MYMYTYIYIHTHTLCVNDFNFQSSVIYETGIPTKTLHQKRLVHYLDQFWLSFISNRSQNYVRTTTHTKILIITIITQLHQRGLFKFILNYCLHNFFFLVSEPIA